MDKKIVVKIERDSVNGNKSISWGWYEEGEFGISFSRESRLGILNLIDDKSDYQYDLIVKDIKKNCKYYDVITSYIEEEGVDYDYVCYSCSESKYKGKIGFMISEGWGYIRHFLIEE